MFIARQPIFNKRLDVYGYELLFRLDKESAHYDGVSSEGATAAVIGGLFEEGLMNIVEDKYAFINFDENVIHSNALELISPDRLIVEMLEGVKVSDKLIKRLEEIKRKGYKIALDDFVEDYQAYPLVSIAKIIKYDLRATPLNTIEEEVKRARSEGKTILAEKVETREEFIKAKEMGFHLFQGYFFSKPNIISKRITKTSSNTQYTRMLWELKKEEPCYQTLAEIIEKDVNLAYKFMRVISHRSQHDLIYSIKTGLTYMGLDEIERWVSMLMLQDVGKNKPKELIKMSLVRTRFAEEITRLKGLTNMRYEASMMGLFSTLDAMLDQPMEEALEDIALTPFIKEALIHKKGKLYPIYRLLLAYEKGDWVEVAEIANTEDIDSNRLGKSYLESIKWANEMSALML